MQQQALTASGADKAAVADSPETPTQSCVPSALVT